MIRISYISLATAAITTAAMTYGLIKHSGKPEAADLMFLMVILGNILGGYLNWPKSIKGVKS